MFSRLADHLEHGIESLCRRRNPQVNLVSNARGFPVWLSCTGNMLNSVFVPCKTHETSVQKAFSLVEVCCSSAHLLM